MKIKLIYPKIREVISYKYASKFMGIKSSAVPLALPTLAALTPGGFDLEIVDENNKAINFEKKVDLVAITFNTHNAKGAYEIADEYKKRGVKVIMGGIHASMLPHETVKHCESVVVGEAELLWTKILEDFKNSSLKSVYTSEGFIDLNDSPTPRWNLINSNKYFWIPVQGSRGCPKDCEFCLDPRHFGRKVRMKSVEKVIEEIKALKRTKHLRSIVFGDYNFFNDLTYVKKLTDFMRKEKITNWMVFGKIEDGAKDEILQLLGQSGCNLLNVGIESISEKSLSALGRKAHSVDEIKKLINNIRSFGLDVFPGFMFGSDNDTPSIFRETVDFINETNLLFPQINILQPYPGSKLYERLKSEGRLLYGEEWEKYDRYKVCFKPKQMTVEELQEGYNLVVKEVFSFDALYSRLNALMKLGFYDDLFFEKQVPSYIKRKMFRIVTRLIPYFLKDRDIKNFVLKCINNKISTHAMWTAVSYQNSYKEQLLGRF
jgi:radical SAM superfamily enzyme YgiQ (UPF0313 family)